MNRPLFAATLMAGLCACAEPQQPQESPAEASQAPALGVDPAHMDTGARPQDDFFTYVNGGWLQRSEIPADRSRWGSFDELTERAEEDVLAILNEASADTKAAPASDTRKIGDLFTSFMDEATIDARALAPLADALADIDALDSHGELAAYWGQIRRTRNTAPLGFSVGQDQAQSDRYITIISQAGLGLPDREYYLAADERSRLLLARYQAHITELFMLAGLPEPGQAARRVIEVETGIARAHWTRVRNRDRSATYNPMTLTELSAMAPGLDWPGYFAAGDLGEIDALVVRQPDYLQQLAQWHGDISLTHWQDYHRYHLLRSFAPYLPTAFAEAHFDFFGRTLNGQPEMRARDRRAVALVQGVLGFMVGQAYVQRHYQPEAQARMAAMVTNLRRAFEQAIDELDWMTEDTRREAQAKLALFNTKIGYPDVWRDYDCVQIEADDLVGNLLRSAACEHERNVARLGQPVDRDEWFITPQTVNAYYAPSMNEIVFPAAILQPPFFNVAADDAINYGAIGAVIGHEITHGFDDQGRRSDGEGNLRDWWTAEDAEQFSARAQRMVEQYNAYEPIEGMNINGALALGENIADLGGLRVAYRAYQLSLEGRSAPVIDGYSGSQRFFLGYGQIWRINYREEALRRQLMTGPHSPGAYRVRGVLSNMPEFYAAFGVEPGDDMYRPEDERVRIW